MSQCGERGGGGVVFQIGGASFLSRGGAPWGASVLMEEGVFEKNCWMGVAPPMHPYYGKHWGVA